MDRVREFLREKTPQRFPFRGGFPARGRSLPPGVDPPGLFRRLRAIDARRIVLTLSLSLLAWEQLLGLTGVFISFPSLFVVEKIHTELKREEMEEEKKKGRLVA